MKWVIQQMSQISSKVIEYDENGNKKIYFPKKSGSKKNEDL